MGTQPLSVLGIDAAWTEKNPSGIALIQTEGERWKCVVVSPSYDSFTATAKKHPANWGEKPIGGLPKFRNILAAAQELLGGKEVDVIAVDMPLSTAPITGWREADLAVSRSFGGMGCGVRPPTMERPGRLSTLFTRTLATVGFELTTSPTDRRSLHQLIEVDPHPAIVRLLNENYRVPYKRGRMELRMPHLLRIVDGLTKEIDNIDLRLPKQSVTGRSIGLKRFEDAIDALVCAWVGAQYLLGNAEPYGDSTAAIWIPRRVPHAL